MALVQEITTARESLVVSKFIEIWQKNYSRIQLQIKVNESYEKLKKKQKRNSDKDQAYQEVLQVHLLLFDIVTWFIKNHKNRER